MAVIKSRCRAPMAALSEVEAKLGAVMERDASVSLTEATTAADEAINRKRMGNDLLLPPRLGFHEETKRLVLLSRAVYCMSEVLERRWELLE